jgi:hypothetical protein
MRLVDSLEVQGRHAEATERARALPKEVLPDSDELWHRWAVLCLARLGMPLREILLTLPRPPEGPGDQEQPFRYAADFRWLVEQLESGAVIRIDCGSEEDYEGPSGEIWRRDCFYQSGEAGRSRDESLDIAGTEDDELYRTERFYPTKGPRSRYSIPLPPGSYAVTLCFTEFWFEGPGRRRFDVLIEGKTVLENYEPPRARADRKTVKTAVSDGSLDIEFRSVIENPNISAIEIRPPAC